MIQRNSSPQINTLNTNLTTLNQTEHEPMIKNETEVRDDLNSSRENTSKLRSLNTYIKEEIIQMRNAIKDDLDYHNKDEIRTDTSEVKSVVIERQGGLANRFVLLLLVLWYFFSALTLYTNKYIVTSNKVDPTIIGTVQMIITCLCGFIQLRFQWNKKYLIIFLKIHFKLLDKLWTP